MTLIRDLIEIPSTQAADDFVLRLTEGVSHADATLRDYVVTPNLVPKFDEALALIQSALGLEVVSGVARQVKAPQSRAAYLHGSFGSGKSHFMAVLHHLLREHPAATGMPELAEPVRKHMPWIHGRKFLLLPVHMLNASSIDEGVLGGYLRLVRKEHPGAPTPALLVAADLFVDAERQRKALGDAKFLEELNSNSTADAKWGALGASWTIARYDAARQASEDEPEHAALVSTLLDTIAQAFRNLMGHSGKHFVKLDHGLEVLTAHAKSLGYDAVIFLLDELILWLASHATDQEFLGREIDKLVNLVEASASNRSIPVVSFIARQRDLRELVSDNLPGVQQLGYVDKLRFHESRFQKITLEDRDLPTIASKRLLAPKDAAAASQIDAQFSASTKIAQDTLDILTTKDRTIAEFRKVYPFSPALVEVLVDASSMLQRDRTALKAMRQLLVQRRDNLALGEFIPLGDLFDVIAQGNDAIVDTFKVSFDRARKLWREKLEPMLEREHSVSAGDLERRDWNDPVRTKFRNDARILKTLLLGSLVSNVPSLRQLNAKRVAALNHGTIKAPFAGQEAQTVLSKLKRWSMEAPEIRLLGSATDPTLSIELEGVDWEGILANAGELDTHGQRVRLLRDLVFADLGVDVSDASLYAHSFAWTWRGTERAADLLFAEVSELRSASLDYDGAAWKVVLDLPLAADSESTDRDRARIAEYLASNRKAHTLVWSPQVFNQQTQRDLGRLVRVQGALRGDNFRRYASHVPETDHATARNLLEGHKVQLENRLRSVILAAYGVSTQGQDGLDSAITVDESFSSLDSTFTPKPPVGSTLRVAMEGLLDQAMAHRYPEHPKFDAKVGKADLKRVLLLCKDAVTATANRVTVEPSRRKETLNIVVPLGLGQMAGLDRPFVLGNDWKQHFLKQQALSADKEWTVANMRAWIDQPTPRGLPEPVEDLLILLFAEQTDRVLFQHGASVDDAEIGRLGPDFELREQRLPPADTWARAVEIANKAFGLGASPGRSGSNVASLASRVREAARGGREDAVRLVQALELRTPSSVKATSARLATMKALAGWLDQLVTASDDVELVARIAKAPLTNPVTLDSLGPANAKAKSVLGAIERANWELIGGLKAVPDARRAEAKKLEEALALAFSQDEYARPIAEELRRIEVEATRLLVQTAPEPTQPTEPGWKQVEHRKLKRATASDAARELDALKSKLESDKGLEVELDWKLYRKEGGA
jgi:hypothetical protein